VPPQPPQIVSAHCLAHINAGRTPGEHKMTRLLRGYTNRIAGVRTKVASDSRPIFDEMTENF
jgi:hypothetical protein